MLMTKTSNQYVAPNCIAIIFLDEFKTQNFGTRYYFNEIIKLLIKKISQSIYQLFYLFSLQLNE
jgi:F0F1-type ATP synthase assembly protein I